MTLPRRTALGAVLSCFLLVGMAAPAAAATNQPLGVTATLGTPCVSGTGPASARHVVALLTRQGTFRARFVTRSNTHGEWSGCFPSTLIGGVNGGDKIRMRAGGQERIVAVPNLLPSVDRVDDVIRGRAKPGQTVDFLIIHSPTLATSEISSHSATAGSNRRYTLDLSGEVDLLGNDLVFASVSTARDNFTALAFVPFVAIEFRSQRLIGATAPDTNLRFVLASADAAVKADRGASSIILGLFIAELYDDEGFAVYPEPGDWLSSTLASDATLEIPISELRARAWNDQVAGRCMPNSEYRIDTPNGSVTGMTSASGAFSRDLSGQINIRRGDNVTVTCRYETGDLFVRTMVVYR